MIEGLKFNGTDSVCFILMLKNLPQEFNRKMTNLLHQTN